MGLRHVRHLILSVLADPPKAKTRDDARDFLRIAGEIGMEPKITVFPLDRVNDALAAVKSDSVNGSAVIVP